MEISIAFQKESSRALNTFADTPIVEEVAGHLITYIRLFNQDDFNEKGRFNMTKEEFYFPSSAYGEVRKISVIEHMRH